MTYNLQIEYRWLGLVTIYTLFSLRDSLAQLRAKREGVAPPVLVPSKDAKWPVPASVNLRLSTFKIRQMLHVSTFSTNGCITQDPEELERRRKGHSLAL